MSWNQFHVVLIFFSYCCAQNIMIHIPYSIDLSRWQHKKYPKAKLIIKTPPKGRADITMAKVKKRQIIGTFWKTFVTVKKIFKNHKKIKLKWTHCKKKIPLWLLLSRFQAMFQNFLIWVNLSYIFAVPKLLIKSSAIRSSHTSYRSYLFGYE